MRASRKVRHVVAIILVTLVAYWLAVGLCAIGYQLVPEWMCKGTHLAPPN